MCETWKAASKYPINWCRMHWHNYSKESLSTFGFALVLWGSLLGTPVRLSTGLFEFYPDYMEILLTEIFIHVCHCVHGGGGLCMISLLVCLVLYSFWGVSVRETPPPRTETPRQKPPGQRPLPQTEPPPTTGQRTPPPPCTVKSGRYASYWNAFLFHGLICHDVLQKSTEILSFF